MATDLFAKAAVSAAVVGLVLALLHRAGPRAGGLAAAMPVTSMPALFWLADERGGLFAAAAAAGSLWGTLASALLAWLVGVALARHAASLPATVPGGAWRTGTPVAIAAAGAMSLIVGALSHHAGPGLCGLVAAVPVVASTTTLMAHRHGGASIACAFLRGYLDGMLAKAVFLVTLGSAWTAGAGAAAWPLALSAAAVALLAQRSLQPARGVRNDG